MLTDDTHGNVIPLTDDTHGNVTPFTDDTHGNVIPLTDDKHGNVIPLTDDTHGYVIPYLGLVVKKPYFGISQLWRLVRKFGCSQFRYHTFQ